MSDNSERKSRPARRKADQHVPNQKVIFFGNHINFIAKSLKDSKPDGVFLIEAWKRVVHTIASDIQNNNKLFEPARFYESCGMKKDDGVQY
jgi:hypothetical protein